MISRISKLTKLQQSKLLDLAEATLDSWCEDGSPEIVWDGVSHTAHLNNEDETVLALYRCRKCRNYISDFEDYSGRDEETDVCPHCGASYE